MTISSSSCPPSKESPTNRLRHFSGGDRIPNTASWTWRRTNFWRCRSAPSKIQHCTGYAKSLGPHGGRGRLAMNSWHCRLARLKTPPYTACGLAHRWRGSRGRPGMNFSRSVSDRWTIPFPCPGVTRTHRDSLQPTRRGLNMSRSAAAACRCTHRARGMDQDSGERNSTPVRQGHRSILSRRSRPLLRSEGCHPVPETRRCLCRPI